MRAPRLLRKFALLRSTRENGVQHDFSEHISLSLKADAYMTGALMTHLASISTSATDSCTEFLPLKRSAGDISPKYSRRLYIAASASRKNISGQMGSIHMIAVRIRLPFSSFFV